MITANTLLQQGAESLSNEGHWDCRQFGAAPLAYGLTLARDQIAAAASPESLHATHSSSMPAAAQSISIPCLPSSGSSSSSMDASDPVSGAFFALAELANGDADGLKAFTAACAALASNLVNMEQLRAAIDPACIEFGCAAGCGYPPPAAAAG